MWSYFNPVRIEFGAGQFAALPTLIGERSYAVVTYPDIPFKDLTQNLIDAAGEPVLIVDDIAPNPDFKLLGDQCDRFTGTVVNPDVIVALGGGSVIDSAKVFAAANGDFRRVRRFLMSNDGADDLGDIPIIAVPTTAGTGSEVTCWATVWDEKEARKFSLARPSLYPEVAVIDPALMLGKPYYLTLATGLDTLSHALESIWNVNANPLSARYAVTAARIVLRDLAELLSDLENIKLRSNIAEASLCAGLAFSNTRTAIAHNLSYSITLGWGVQHGIACSFTLPAILQSVIGMGGFREASLKEIFGPDLEQGAAELTSFMKRLGVGHRFADYGIPAKRYTTIIDEAFAGERGKNFIGSKENFLRAANLQGTINTP